MKVLTHDSCAAGHYQDIGSALTLAVLAAKASVIQTIFLE